MPLTSILQPQAWFAFLASDLRPLSYGSGCLFNLSLGDLDRDINPDQI
jgi:hypothetical protein